MSERDRNRERMPQVAAWVDGLREVFGPVTVLYAQEGGVELGERQPQGVVATQTVAAEPSEPRGSRRVPARIPARSR